MGIYIKGMEMPKNCAECPCRMIGYTKDHCNVLGKFIDFAVGSEGRREDCPLIEVPPHGRLIDADALEENAQKRLLMCSKNDNQFQKPYEVMRAIALAPTIIPADKDGET